MEKLHNWLFHYNPYTGYWNAFKRENLTKYFEGKLADKEVLKNKRPEVLAEYISKHT